MDRDQRNLLLKWFGERSAKDANFISDVYIPSVEKLHNKYELELHQVCRSGELSKVNYVQGKLDGVQEIIGLIAGIRMSESRDRVVPTLMERILQKFGGTENAGGK